MYFSTAAVLATFSATTVFAIPTGFQSVDNSVVVQLKPGYGQDVNTEFQKVQLGQREEKMPQYSGPFKQVNLHVGKGVQKQDLRCQVLDHDGKPIVMTRGENIDITFSDADKGAWTFKKESMVKDIICDPAFQKAGADAKDVTVILSGPSELATQTVFANFSGKQSLPPVASDGPYNTVELRVGALVEKQDLRCKISVADMHGNLTPITIKRGQNIDTTFSDAGKGPWSFLKPTESKVTTIECNPAFVAMPAPM